MIFHGTYSQISPQLDHKGQINIQMIVFSISIYFISQGEKNIQCGYIYTILKYMDCEHVLSSLRKSTPTLMTPSTEPCSAENKNLVGMTD